MSPHRLFLFIASLLAAAALLGACGSDDDPIDAGAGLPGADDGGDDGGDDAASSGGSTRPWIAGDWVLDSATGPDGPLSIPDGLALGLSIAGPDEIRGDLGCNSFGGTISAPFDDDADAGPLTVSDMAQTEMACEHLDFEVKYGPLLAAATRWELAPPDGLVFRGEGIELTYRVAEPAAPVALEETIWVFDTIFDGEGVERTASTPRLDKPEVTLVLADGVATLSSEDCGPIELAATWEPGGSDGAFTPEDPAAATAAASADCDDPDSNLPVAVAGVADATGYMINDGRLTFIGLPGETVSFRAQDG